MCQERRPDNQTVHPIQCRQHYRAPHTPHTPQPQSQHIHNDDRKRCQYRIYPAYGYYKLSRFSKFRCLDISLKFLFGNALALRQHILIPDTFSTQEMTIAKVCKIGELRLHLFLPDIPRIEYEAEQIMDKLRLIIRIDAFPSGMIPIMKKEVEKVAVPHPPCFVVIPKRQRP